MTTAVKCKRCHRFIVRNDAGDWILPNSKFPSTLCLDGVHPHDPDQDPDNGSGRFITPTGIAIGASIAEAGLI
jgi:hypothetical protein